MACATIAEDQSDAATYVDDPLIIFCGTEGENELNVGKVIGMLLAMGVLLSIQQGSRLKRGADAYLD